jgi:hypothetical protein
MKLHKNRLRFCTCGQPCMLYCKNNKIYLHKSKFRQTFAIISITLLFNDNSIFSFCRKYPTVTNVKKKLTEEKAKREKGQVAQTKTYRFVV